MRPRSWTGYTRVNPAGIPSYHAGKVTRLYEWLDGRDTTLEGAYFYSDSHNDLPLAGAGGQPGGGGSG